MGTRMSVFEIRTEYREIRDKLLENPTLPDAQNFLKAIQQSGEEKLQQLYFVIQQLEVEASAGKEAINVAKNHVERRENSVKKVKQMMIELACELNLKKLDTPHCRFNIMDGRTTLDVPDIDQVDSDYVLTTMVEQKTLDKKKLEQDLSALDAKRLPLQKKLQELPPGDPGRSEVEKQLASLKIEGAGWKTGDPFIKFLKAKGDQE